MPVSGRANPHSPILRPSALRIERIRRLFQACQLGRCIIQNGQRGRTTKPVIELNMHDRTTVEDGLVNQFCGVEVRFVFASRSEASYAWSTQILILSSSWAAVTHLHRCKRAQAIHPPLSSPSASRHSTSGNLRRSQLVARLSDCRRLREAHSW